jgi:hypothetical protein
MTLDELENNPFLVLGVTPAASRLEVERAGQKLLAQLVIGAASSLTYASPSGPRPRDEALVRQALAALRDPQQRIWLEFWADGANDAPAPEALPAWREAHASIGWSVAWED